MGWHGFGHMVALMVYLSLCSDVCLEEMTLLPSHGGPCDRIHADRGWDMRPSVLCEAYHGLPCYAMCCLCPALSGPSIWPSPQSLLLWVWEGRWWEEGAAATVGAQRGQAGRRSKGQPGTVASVRVLQQ